MYPAVRMGDVHSIYYFPFQAVHLVLHREVQAYLHHLLAAHLESIGIVFCLYLGESLFSTLVELQLHHVDGISSLHRDIDSALRRMRNRMYGGVRGRKTKVGEKLLRFPTTRFIYKS